MKSVDDSAPSPAGGRLQRADPENLKTLATIHANIWIRIPLIPGFNLDDAQLEASARYVASIPGVQQVNLLPYHRMGTGKADAGPAVTAEVRRIRASPIAGADRSCGRTFRPQVYAL